MTRDDSTVIAADADPSSEHARWLFLLLPLILPGMENRRSSFAACTSLIGGDDAWDLDRDAIGVIVFYYTG